MQFTISNICNRNSLRNSLGVSKNLVFPFEDSKDKIESYKVDVHQCRHNVKLSRIKYSETRFVRKFNNQVHILSSYSWNAVFSIKNSKFCFVKLDYVARSLKLWKVIKTRHISFLECLSLSTTPAARGHCYCWRHNTYWLISNEFYWISNKFFHLRAQKTKLSRMKLMYTNVDTMPNFRA